MRRPFLLPLVPLYAAGLRLKNLFRAAPRRLDQPVLSIGSLSVGGAGKTPVVLALAALLKRHGISSDVLSRGYGRGSGAVERVDPGGSARRFGDEPMEMAQAGFPVYVGADRYAAGRLAESQGLTTVHLLDDGFQHLRLHRTLDIVLLTRADIQDHLLPAGNLRETFQALRRADILVLREEESEALLPFVAEQAKALVWNVRRELLLPPDLTRPVIFCGIARPEDFFIMLRRAGCNAAGFVTFPDHHPYTSEDIQRLCDAAIHVQADSFLTTAKDAVKLTASFHNQLTQIAPLHIAELRVAFPAEQAVWSSLQPYLRGA